MRWLCLSLSASLVAPYTHVPIPQPLTHAPIKSRYMSQTACAASSTWKLQSLKMSTSAQAQLSGGDDDAVYVAALEAAAQKCLDEGCPVDLLEEVVAHLKAESLELTRRQQAMLILIGKLDALATAPASKAVQSEIKKWWEVSREPSPRQRTTTGQGKRLATAKSQPDTILLLILIRRLVHVPSWRPRSMNNGP